MVSTFLSFGALFTSALLFLMGGSVMNTQLSLRMAQAGFSTPAIGITMACYFLGLVSGYFLCHRLIHWVGHIRSFTVFAAATTVIIILHGFYISAIFWAILRFFKCIFHCSDSISIIPVDEQVNFIAMKNTSSVAMVLDPRTEVEDEQIRR